MKTKIHRFKHLVDVRTGRPLEIAAPAASPRVFPITGRRLEKGETIRRAALKSAQRLIRSLEAQQKGLPSSV